MVQTLLFRFEKCDQCPQFCRFEFRYRHGRAKNCLCTGPRYCEIEAGDRPGCRVAGRCHYSGRSGATRLCPQNTPNPGYLSVQGSATSHAAINLIRDHFGIRRAVLPRVPSLDQIRHIINNTGVKPALIDLGVSAIRVEGRQRSPACVAQVTHVLRQAIHHAGNPAKQAQAARWPQEHKLPFVAARC